ncbi:hypothetical protein EBU02_08845 [bacterium]|nr:hypothetical protein [bacterium]
MLIKIEIMNIQTLKSRLLMPILAGSSLAIAFCPPLKAESCKPPSEDTSTASEMCSMFRDMMQRHVDLMNLMKSKDTELAVEVEKLKSSKADQKLDLTTATLALLIKQQAALHAEMQKMVEMEKLQLEKCAWTKSLCMMMKDMSEREKPHKSNKETEQKPQYREE